MARTDIQIFDDEFPLYKSCSAMEDMWQKNEANDVKIELLDGGDINAHRLVLAARVPYIRQLVNQKKEEPELIFQWKTVPKCIAECLISYLYSGRLVISENNVNGILVLAKMLRLRKIVDWAVRYFLTRLNAENVSVRFLFARWFGNQFLIDACTSFMRSSYEQTVASDTFLHLPADTLLSLLRDDNLNVSNEEVVFQSLLRWVKPNCATNMSRLNRLPELLTEVRWKETSVNFRIGIATGDVITDNLPCMRFLNSVNTWIGNPGSMPCPFNSNPRKPSTTISDALPDVVSSQFWEVSSEPESSIVLLGRPTDGDGNRWVCRLYDPQTGLGRLLGHCKRRPLSAVACLRGGRLLLIGGFNGENEWGDAASRLDELDARSGLWRPLSPMRTRRAFGHTATVIQLEGRQEGREVVVVCGGEDEKPFNVLSSCELYDPRENRWWSLPDMQVRRCGAAAAALSDGRLFVFGGGREGSENSVEFCRLGDWHKLRGPCTSSFWRHAAPMSWCSQWRRYEHAAAAFRNRIFVAGGWPDEQEVQIFRPPAYEEEDAPGQWTRLILPQQHMNNQRSGLSLLVHKNRLFALGGDGWNSVEEFSPGEGEKEGAMTDNFESWHWLRQKSPANIDLIMSAAVIEF